LVFLDLQLIIAFMKYFSQELVASVLYNIF